MSIFSKLHRWARHQDENFTTEILIYLINESLKLDKDYAAGILEFISGGFIQLTDITDCLVSGQYRTEHGVPDIVIETTNKLVFVEVKVDSDFGFKQISRYRKALKKQNPKKTKLVTLTRYSMEYGISDDEKPDLSISWSELSEKLAHEHSCDASVNFIAKDFLEYLTYRGLAMEKVGWQLIGGITEMQNLIVMLAEALAQSSASKSRFTSGKDFTGYNLEDGNFFIGLYYSQPDELYINTEFPLPDKDPSGDDTQNIGAQLIDKKYYWNYSLTNEENHFFSRSKLSQTESLKEYIDSSLSEARELFP